MTFKEFCTELLQKYGYSDFKYDQVISFTQNFSNITCGLGGIGGDMMSLSQVFIFFDSAGNAIVIGPEWGYCVENVTETFSIDVYNHNIAKAYSKARIDQYGNVKSIKIR